MLLNAFVIAVRQLRRNGSRTLLTSLGIVIGVAAVILMVGVGRGATAAVNNCPTETSASTPKTINSTLGGISMPSTELPATMPTENFAV